MRRERRSSGEALPIGNSVGEHIGWLSMIGDHDVDDHELVSELTAWRNANRGHFLTQFEATEERTSAWLREVVIPDPSRAFYVISNAENVRIGHLGVRGLESRCPELDNMIRGRSGGDPKLMYWAEIALIARVFEITAADSICLHVFSNNWIPISVHRSIGFQLDKLSPLSRTEVGGEVQMMVDSEEGTPQDFGYQRMVLDRSKFFELFPERSSERKA
jgi:hypothetical protein